MTDSGRAVNNCDVTVCCVGDKNSDGVGSARQGDGKVFWTASRACKNGGSALKDGGNGSFDVMTANYYASKDY